MTTTTETRIRLAPRTDVRVGAVDEYSGLQRAAMDRLVQQGLEAAAATVRLRADAQRLVADHSLDDHEAGVAVVPFVQAAEDAIAAVHDDFRDLTLHVLRMARYRLGLS